MPKDSFVLEARAVEADFFDIKSVWTKVPRQRSFEKTGELTISTRWMDTNKEVEEHTAPALWLGR